MSPNALAQPPLPERVRFFSAAMICMFVTAWLSWFWPFDNLLDRSETPLGADFAMFYVAGQAVRSGVPEHLYNEAENQRNLQALIPGIAPVYCLPYRYPPFVAALISPLTRLPYLAAFAAFALASVIAMIGSVRLLGTRLSVLQATGWRPLLLAVFGWPVTLEILIGGQASLFAVAICAGVCVLHRDGRLIAAGAVLALAAYKPNVLAILGLGLIVRSPRMLLGTIPVLALLAAAGCVATGWDRLTEYAHILTRLSSDQWNVESPWWKVQSLAGPLAGLLGGRARIICLLTGAAIAVAIGLVWRRQSIRTSSTVSGVSPMSFAGNAMWAHLLVVNALFNPYTPIYDLILMGLAAVLLAEHVAEQMPQGNSRQSAVLFSPSWQLILWGALSFGPHLSQAVARRIGFQLFPLLLAVAWLLLWGVMSKRTRSTDGFQETMA